MISKTLGLFFLVIFLGLGACSSTCQTGERGTASQNDDVQFYKPALGETR